MASRSLRDLAPAMRDRTGEWLRLCNSKGVAVLVYCTFRSEEEQAELYAQGRTKPGPIVTNAKPGESLHQHRVAFDAVPAYLARQNPGPVTLVPKLDWAPFSSTMAEWEFIEAKRDGKRSQAIKTLDYDWRVMVEVAKVVGLEWAGWWSGTLVEYVHFDQPKDLT